MGTEATSSRVSATQPASGPAPSTVWVVDGRPDYHYASSCSRVSGADVIDIPIDQAVEDGFEPCPDCTTSAPVSDTAAPTPAGEVWVVDGHPEYHVAGCERLTGLPAESIPVDQAIEDGFVPCPVCSTTVAEAAPAPEPERADSDTPSAAPTELDEVWVIDGHPDYHQVGCRELIGTDAEPIPLEQAIEDGFSPCPVCLGAAAPIADAPSDAPSDEPADEPAEAAEHAEHAEHAEPAEALAPTTLDEVWVVDGYPEFHRAGCTELDGKPAEAIPLDQAVEDGFEPCSVCAPIATAVPAVAEPEPEPVAVEPEPAPVEAGPAPVEAESLPIEPEPVVAAAVAATTTDVAEAWVVDGYAHYHHADCPTLVGLAAEPIPLDEAIEVGFAPCTTCYGAAADGSAPAAEPEPEVAAAISEPEAVAMSVPEPDAAPAEAAPVEPVIPASSGGDELVSVVDGYLNYHRTGCSRIDGADAVSIPLSQAVEDGFQPCGYCDPPRLTDLAEESMALEASLANDELPMAAPSDAMSSNTVAAIADDEVWVVDGYPDYHARGCSRILGMDAEPIPLTQATEDGFTRCTECLTPAAGAAALLVLEPPDLSATEFEPAAEAPAAEAPVVEAPAAEAPAAEAPAAEAPAAEEASFIEPPREVVVADGYPYFHESGCPELEGLVPIPVPFDQATEDGFQPCPVCMLAGARVAPEAPAEAETEAEAEAGPPAEEVAAAPVHEPVFVVEGRPRYHREGCMIIKGRDARELTYEQAVADGFLPCSLCESAH